jgi:basic amino acid/polyamine antiporter, APA family
MGTPSTLNASSEGGAPHLVQGLKLFDCTTLVMGSMIGSGIFIVSAEAGRELGSPGLLMIAWVLSGLMTVIAAVTYGELAAMMPKAGGQYVYLREAFNPLAGFLYGWTMFLVIQTGTLAAVAVAFAKFLGIFLPAISGQHYLLNLGSFTVPVWGHSIALTVSTEQGVAILCLVFLAVINIFGLRTGAWLQNVFTTLKVGALVGLVGVGLWWGFSRAPATPSSSYFHGIHWGTGTLTLLAVALVGPLFSSDAWNNVTFTGAEIVNPKRNLPLALFLGTFTVCTVYLLCNWAYLQILPFYGTAGAAGPLAHGLQFAAEDRVGTAAMQVVLGSAGQGLMAAAIIISTFGCANGLTLAGARIYYAMAKDRVFFSSVSRVHRRFHTPAVSLMFQAFWACLLTLSGTYNDLLDYVIFAVVLFYILTILGLFRLRRTRPDAPRPVRAWGYPVLPALYILMAVFVDWALLLHKTQRSIAGLCIVAVGIPVFYVWRWRSRSQAKDVG